MPCVRPLLMVMVDVPAPLMLAGLKLMELPLPWPEAVSAMLPLKPPVAELVIVTVPVLLR